MNRCQIFGKIALLVAIVTGTASGQVPGYGVGYGAAGMGYGGYPATPAAYYSPTAPGPSGVYPAAVGMAPMPGAVQLAGCASGGCDSPGCGVPTGPGCGMPGMLGGCDSGACGAGGGCGAGGCGLLGGAGGLFGGAGGLLGGLGQHLAGGYDGYNSQLLGQAHGPYGSGGCCLPRAFDVQADWLYWTRDDSASRQFSSLNILGTNALDSNQLDYDEESGFRITGAYLIGPATSLEASYFGGFNWSDSAQATSNGNLFSVFSNFGAQVFNGIVDTGFANLHRLSMSSELDNAEINLRHRWVSANCLVHSSYLVGIRYFRFREDLRFFTSTDSGVMDYGVKADNDLVGPQIGTEMHVCVSPRFKIGGEVKAGVYGTSSSQRTHMTSTNCPELREYLRDNDVAFLGEGGVNALYRLSPSTTLRVGYQVLFVDGIATALDNFNSAAPLTSRAAYLDNNADMFFHGATLGFECMW